MLLGNLCFELTWASSSASWLTAASSLVLVFLLLFLANCDLSSSTTLCCCSTISCNVCTWTVLKVLVPELHMIQIPCRPWIAAQPLCQQGLEHLVWTIPSSPRLRQSRFKVTTSGYKNLTRGRGCCSWRVNRHERLFEVPGASPVTHRGQGGEPDGNEMWRSWKWAGCGLID